MDDFRGVDRLTKENAQDLDRFLDHETDIAASRSLVPLPVTKAGIDKQWVSFTCPSFVDPRRSMAVSGEAEAYAALTPTQRGVHMSRVVEAIAMTNDRYWDSVRAFVAGVTSEVAERQQLAEATMRFVGRATDNRLTPVTRKWSPDTFDITLTGRYAAGRVSGTATLGAAVMTACPCTQAFSRYTLIDRLAADMGFDAANDVGFSTPTFTHSQRGRATLELELHEDVDLSHAYEAMNSAAHITHELLKRPDEHDLVRRSHERPQFTEDVVRDVVAAFVTSAGGLADPTSTITATCRNLESIHNHDAYSEITIPIADALARLG
ncbi:GTP cyclohydrolase, FolE2/MptA family [Pseudonocardia sp. TRM90224]|uniref:GTP cyclohydrolase, FolE2/MptA family n=1 Tax=Pseudonocardia sp. TRM90224 TaxID=2812678 RepID=UPI001E57C670|nr:GTP cyclohydrolase, FolE2/MptA family [Pseudonocardia sp. TRM90224]